MRYFITKLLSSSAHTFGKITHMFYLNDISFYKLRKLPIEWIYNIKYI